MIERTRKISGCDDGTCPRVDETSEPGMIAVQGYRPSPAELAAMSVPDGEAVVLVPRHVLDDWAAARP
jgi:hypothetical protein